MPFYEAYVCTHGKCLETQVRQLFLESARTVQRHSGLILELKDYGLRQLAFPVLRPRVGKFWFGRYYELSFCCSPKAMEELRNLYRTSNVTIRFRLEKRIQPKKMAHQMSFNK
eukprot:Platyproteum_vivax@DN12491_c0_g1_i1.p1